MRLDFGHWHCTLCGQLVGDVREDARPTSEIRGVSGRPTVRVVYVDRNEVHRCELGPNGGVPGSSFAA
ncbi:MAG TPA: hypothetical protein VGO03_07575 [Acidimicrobiia bacterium]|jgi:hypothetical protein